MGLALAFSGEKHLRTGACMGAMKRQASLGRRLHALEFEGDDCYRTGGTTRFDDSEHQKRRISLKYSQRLRKACRRFWEVCGKGDDAALSFYEYIGSFHSYVSAVLAPELTESEIYEAATE